MTTIAGTGTGVGKTVVAALAGPAAGYVKPVRTGVPGDVPDVDTVAHLSGARCHELARYVVGSWPHTPGLPERSNVLDPEVVAGEPLSGVVPAGAGAPAPGAFREVARAGLSPRFGGRFAGVT